MARKLSQKYTPHDIQMKCQMAAHDKASPWPDCRFCWHYQGDSGLSGLDCPDLCLHIGEHFAFLYLTEALSS